MKRGYQKILDGLASAQNTTDDPQEKLRQMTRNYIEVSLQMSDEYKAVQLNSTPGVVAQTASLFKGAAAKKPALKILFQGLKEIYRDRDIDDSVIELTAQIIAASTFGLIIRLIMEQDLISEEQKTNLIDHFIRITVDGMVLGNTLDRG